MSVKEHMDEYRYIYQERLGIICGDATPTAQQSRQAGIEAREHMDRLMKGKQHEQVSKLRW